MPIYEYKCRSCAHEFETLVLKGTTPACPSCQGTELERLLSLPALKSETTHALAMRAAKKRDASQARTRVHEQIEYERKHHDD